MRSSFNAIVEISESLILRIGLAAVGIVLVAVSAVRFQAPKLLSQYKVLTDFDAFYIAGRMAGGGRAGDTYHMQTMLEAQYTISGAQSFMPWTYPPPFTLLVQGLAHLPIGIAFAAFALASFAFYIWVLRRIAGKWCLLTMIGILPAIVLNLRTGQNGFLMAGLIGLCLMTFESKRPIAGLPLGLMIIKPHLGVGVGLIALLQKRWQVLFVAATVVLALLGVSTCVYGIGIWSDFRNAVQEASGFLANGYYPLFRMSSIYASAYTFGFSPLGAMALQLVGAFIALGLLGRFYFQRIDSRSLSAFTCIASLFVSPYAYDYDLTILGVGLAFILPNLVERATGRELFLLLLLSWFVCGFGLVWTTVMTALSSDTGVQITSDNAGVALIAPALLALCYWTARVLSRSIDRVTYVACIRLDASDA